MVNNERQKAKSQSFPDTFSGQFHENGRKVFFGKKQRRAEEKVSMFDLRLAGKHILNDSILGCRV